MGGAKIEIKVGAVTFSGEGDGKWLSEQLDKVLGKIHQLAEIKPAASDSGDGGQKQSTGKSGGTLASFLTAKSAKGNDTKKFLATALWLHDAEGMNRLTTSAVVKAMKTHNQGSPGNASQCLALNIKRGFCQKDGKKEFYVTDEGRSELGR